ncbi:hypothetical protein EDB86DRAFT_3089117 [Lactarius hatsudake]|nr:hypothetical protein EDB86DRAFT_3089117 [Lactarius hatsudake]
MPLDDLPRDQCPLYLSSHRPSSRRSQTFSFNLSNFPLPLHYPPPSPIVSRRSTLLLLVVRKTPLVAASSSPSTDPLESSSSSAADPLESSSSPSADPLESPSSDTTTRPALIFPSPANPLPGSFPSSETSENSVPFSALVAASSARFLSPASSNSSPSDSSSVASSSPAHTSLIPSLSSSYVSFSEILPTHSLILDNSPDSNLDQNLDPSPSYHSTIVAPSTSSLPTQLSSQTEVSSSALPLDTVTEPTNQVLVPTTLSSLPPSNVLESLTLDSAAEPSHPPPLPVLSTLPPTLPAN